MSIFVQEVLGLLQLGKRKSAFRPTQDYIEFSRLSQSSLNTGSSYVPKMEAFTMRMDDFIVAMADGDTTYDLYSSTIGANVGINLAASSGSTDLILLEEGTNITLTNTGTDRITIDAIVPVTSVEASNQARYAGIITSTTSGVVTVGMSPGSLVDLATGMTSDDLFYVTDVAPGADENKKIKWGNLVTSPGNIASVTAGANISLAFSGVNNTTVEIAVPTVVNSIDIGGTAVSGDFTFTGTGLTLGLTAGTPNTINFGVDYLGSDNIVESSPLSTAPTGSDWLLWGDASGTHNAFRSTLNVLFDAYAETSPLTQVSFRADTTGLVSGGSAVSGSFGALTVLYTGTGEWTVSWAQSTLDTNYQIMVYCDDSPGTNNSYITAKTTSSFQIRLVDLSGSPVAGSINVTVKH